MTSTLSKKVVGYLLGRDNDMLLPAQPNAIERSIFVSPFLEFEPRMLWRDIKKVADERVTCEHA